MNPNALAFRGPGYHVIEFNRPVSSVSLAVRGTSSGDEAGPNGQFPFTAADGPFENASAVVFALDRNGFFFDFERIENDPLQSDPADLVREINFETDRFRGAIFGLQFRSYGSVDSGVFIGGLGVTTAEVIRGDLNGDGVVSVFDISVLLRALGTDDPDADLNSDGIVDSTNVQILIDLIFG
ncbi:MAG: dockerin type I repeat-containing protein [Planctomycetota bacterium]